MPWLAACSNAAQPSSLAPEGGPGCPTACAGTYAAGRCIVELAQTTGPTDIAVDSTSAYFTSCPAGAGGGAALRVPLGGGHPLTIASSSAGCPVGLALGGPGVFLALGPGGVVEVPRAGGALVHVVQGAETTVGVATDGAALYWTNEGGGLLKIPFAGGAPTVLATGQSPSPFTRPVVDGASVYWGDIGAGAIRKVPLDGGSVTTITTVGAVAALAVHGAYVYFAASYLLMRAPIAGGAATPVGTAAGGAISAVAVDEVSAYYTSDGAVWKAPLDGSRPPEALAMGQREPNAVVVDATSAYWTNALDGRVMKATPK